MDRVSARSLVESWLEGQEGLSQSKVSYGFELKGDWAFKVVLSVPQVGREFTALKLIVKDSSVHILRDHRAAVERILQSPSGFAREDQLFQAFEEVGIKYPDWFVHLKRSEEFVDRRGIDGWGKVCIPGIDTVSIPFQIKSSKAGVGYFFAENPSLKNVVITIIVNESNSPHLLRTRLLGILGNVRIKIIRGEYDLAEFKQTITNVVFGKLS